MKFSSVLQLVIGESPDVAVVLLLLVVVVVVVVVIIIIVAAAAASPCGDTFKLHPMLGNSYINKIHFNSIQFNLNISIYFI